MRQDTNVRSSADKSHFAKSQSAGRLVTDAQAAAATETHAIHRCPERAATEMHAIDRRARGAATEMRGIVDVFGRAPGPYHFGNR